MHEGIYDGFKEEPRLTEAEQGDQGRGVRLCWAHSNPEGPERPNPKPQTLHASSSSLLLSSLELSDTQVYAP